MEEVKEFQKKERMGEAQKYADTLDEIQAKIHGFMEEVSKHTPLLQKNLHYIRGNTRESV